MEPLTELLVVEETKHLVPIRETMSKMLFGERAFFIDSQPSHRDTATDAIKRGDGLVWLPWQSELWLLEIEWKKDSNFHEQIRPFARSEVPRLALEQLMLECLLPFGEVLGDIAPNIREGHLPKAIVKRTTDKYFHDDHGKQIFTPDLWVVLGHAESDMLSLREEYKRSIRAWFVQTEKRYVLSTARAFSNDVDHYILLEQECSEGQAKVPSTLLFPVPAWSSRVPTHAFTVAKAKPAMGSPSVSAQVGQTTSDADLGPGAALFWQSLSAKQPQLDRKNVRLRISLLNRDPIDCRVEWRAGTNRLLVINDRTGKADILARVLKELTSADSDDVNHAARHYGEFVDVATGGFIARFRDVEKQVKALRSR